MTSGARTSHTDSSVRGNESLPSLGDRQVGSARRPKLPALMREALRSRHYSRRTEQSYCRWIKRYTRFHDVRHPGEMGRAEINAFLTSLAVKEKVSAWTQNQALYALLFLYRHVVGSEVGDLDEVIRAPKPKRLPVVMTRDEVKSELANLTNVKWLMASLVYGAGLRLMECLRLRMQDIYFSRNQMIVRLSAWDAQADDGKGAKDRITIALDRKYPNAPKEWRWQWVFPQENRWKNQKTGKEGSGSRIDHPKALNGAVRKSGLAKRATCQTFWHSFATQLFGKRL